MSNLKKIEGGVTTPQGFTAGAVYTAIKKRENKKPDVAVLYSDLPCSCAACFTTNKFCAAPVILDREILKKGKARAGVINCGNANAATGKEGIGDNLVQQANEALEARELIKGRVLESAMLTPREACQTLARLTRSEPVQVIGTKFVLYRESHSKEKKDKIVLVKDRKKPNPN